MEQIKIQVLCEVPPNININIDDFVESLPLWNTDILDVSEDNKVVKIQLFINAKDITEFSSWRTEYEQKNKLTYYIRGSWKGTGRYLLHKQCLSCHHNTKCNRLYEDRKDKTHTTKSNRVYEGRNDRTHTTKSKEFKLTKNTDCPSNLTVKVHAVKNRYQGKDKRLEHILTGKPEDVKPCEIILYPLHNHSVDDADSLRFRKVSKEVKQQLLKLFNSGHSPSTALEMIKLDIQLKYDNYDIILADRQYCPGYNYSYHLFTKEFKNKDKPFKLDDRGLASLQEYIDTYNKVVGDSCITMECGEDESYIVCICTPLMKRVHEFCEESSQIVFMDSFGSAHKHSRVFFLLTHSEAGILPLGLFITSNASVEVICLGFSMLKELVGDTIFYNHPDGPTLFFTGDSKSEKSAVSISWPNSQNRLCISHVLQDIRMWLVKSPFDIPKEMQTTFIEQFRMIMFAKTASECHHFYEIASSSANIYPKYKEYLKQYWERKEMWVLIFRNRLSRGGRNANNFCETAMKILKDRIFKRVRTFNVIQLCDFIITILNQYYEQRLLDVAHNKQSCNSIFIPIKLPSDNIFKSIDVVNEQFVFVPSETIPTLNYVVDMVASTCTCSSNSSTVMCKHIYWASVSVFERYAKSIDSIETRRLFYRIATGINLTTGLLFDDITYAVISHTIENNASDYKLEAGINGGAVNDLKLCPPSSDLSEVSANLKSELLNDIDSFIDKSPEEGIEAVDILSSNISQIETSAAFVSAGSPPEREHDYTPHPDEEIYEQPPDIMMEKKRRIV